MRSKPASAASRHRRVLMVKVTNGDGAGYGECVAMEDPYFNAETIDTAWIIVTKHLVSLLVSSPVERAADVNKCFARYPRQSNG